MDAWLVRRHVAPDLLEHVSRRGLGQRETLHAHVEAGLGEGSHRVVLQQAELQIP